MNRRETIASLFVLGAASGPLVTKAQQANKVWRIGYLGPPADVAPHLVKAFQDGLRELGYVEGRNIAVDYRWTTDRGVVVDENALLINARELVAKKVDVLAVSIDLPIIATKKVAGKIPIVMMNVSDPIELGLIASLAHPGGNVTGLTRLSPELIGKNLQLLLEMVPGAKRIGLLTFASGAMTPLYVRNAQQAAQSRGLALQVVEIRAAADLETAFAALKRGRAEALLVPSDGLFFTVRAQIAKLTLERHLPAIFAYTENVEAGGLLAYSPSSTENYRRAAGFIDKILRGANPGDIPVEQPTTFELAVNKKTAKAIGVVIPPPLLLRADRVIE